MNNEDFIYTAGPSITDKEVEYVSDAVRNAWYAGAYGYIHEFENAVSSYVGRRYALALPSATAAIHLSLEINGIGPGDEVIVPDFTWFATAAPLLYIGAKPVFVDVDRDTWCISPESVEEHITDKTKAIYTVDIYGNMPDYDRIIRIAQEYNLLILEDSAQAMGSSYKGKKAGSFGITSAFSFHGTKLVTTGEGGMLLSDDESLIKRADKLASSGKSETRLFWIDELGYKYKYTSIQAALGLAQMERLQELLVKRKQIFSWYKENLFGVEGIQMNMPGDDVVSNYWMSTVIFDEDIYDLDKEAVIENFKNHNIQCRPAMYALSSLPPFRDLKPAWKNVNADRVARMGINLPTPHILTEEQAVRTSDVLKKFLRERHK